MAATRNQYFLPLTRPLTMAVAFVLDAAALHPSGDALSAGCSTQ